MENYNSQKKNTLILTNEVFNILVNSVIQKFTLKNNIRDNYKETQLFGFGNYDTEKPNLKSDFEKIIKGYINGKYLYNKKREASTGKPIIKISNEYKYVFFNFLGFKDIDDFLKQDIINPTQKKKQLDILSSESIIEDYFYVSYYYGEDNKLNKGEVVIRNQWKNIEMNYIYENKYGKTVVYSYFGNIIQNEGFVFFDTKYFTGNKKNEGAKFIFFTGKSALNERDYLIGTYSGFDKYDNTIAGKMILKKIKNKRSMEMEVANKEFDAVICQELNKKRIVVDSIVRKNPLLFSKKSPYAKILNDISNKYLLKIIHKNKTFELKLNIVKYHLKIKSIDESLFFENDKINLVNNGQVINMVFSINGLYFIKRISIYIKAHNLKKEKGIHEGKYTAVDVNNNILSGIIIFEKL